MRWRTHRSVSTRRGRPMCRPNLWRMYHPFFKCSSVIRQPRSTGPPRWRVLSMLSSSNTVPADPIWLLAPDRCCRNADCQVRLPRVLSALSPETGGLDKIIFCQENHRLLTSRTSRLTNSGLHMGNFRSADRLPHHRDAQTLLQRHSHRLRGRAPLPIQRVRQTQPC